jgi:glycosyltransferase involved in cell wall biosynthesis
MRIQIISNLFPPHFLGGYEILCAQVCQELARRGHRVTVLTSIHGLKGGVVEREPLRVYRLLRLYLPFEKPAGLMRGRRWWFGRHNYRRAAEVISQERPEIIFIWSQCRLTLGAARAAQDSGVPVAYTFNDEHVTGYLPARFTPAPRALACYAADRWLFPGNTLYRLELKHVTCISHLLKANLIARGVPIHGARVIYQGIPLQQFPVKAEVGKVAAPTRVLFVGQLNPYKGAHTLIEAAHLVSGRNGLPPLRVSIVGDGSEGYKSQLRDRAARGKAAVEFLGKTEHALLPRIYREHDIFVFPSIWQEPFGLTHLEAMASGTPVISTAHGGQGEFLRDGENALIFEKENAAQLAEHILQLVRLKTVGPRLAANARAAVERSFTLERYVAELESFLGEAAQGRRALSAIARAELEAAVPCG